MKHHADLGHFQLVQADLLLMEGKPALVNHPLAAAGARDGDLSARGDVLRAVPRAHDAGDAQLAGNDRGMAGAAPLIGHNGRGDFHDWHPVGVGHLGDQHVPLLEFLDPLGAADHVGRAGPDLIAHRHPLGQHRTRLFQHHPPDHAGLAPGHDGFRAGLHDEQLAALAILGPFHVHWLVVAGLFGVVVFDLGGPAGEGEHLFGLNAELLPLLGRNLHVVGAAAFRRATINHLLLFFPEVGINDRLETLGQGGLVDIELVRVDGALHYVLPQPVTARDVGGILEPAFGVYGEHHPRRRQIAPHHLLHGDGKGHREVVEFLLLPVSDGPVGEQRGEAGPAGLQQRGVAPNVEVGVLLAGKGGVGEILGGGARSHGGIHFRAVALAQLVVGVLDRLLHVGRHGGAADERSNFFAPFGQQGEVRRVEPVQQLFDLAPDAAGIDVVIVGVGGNGKPVRHAYPLVRQIDEHFPEGGVLPTHHRHVADAHFRKPIDQLVVRALSHGGLSLR